MHIRLLHQDGELFNMTYISSPQPAQGQTVFVRKTGSDATGDGSYTFPYLTINQALTSITDNSSSKRYKIDVGPGQYTEIQLALKPNIWIVGCGQPIGGPCRVSTTAVTVDSSWNTTAGARGGVSNIYFNGSTQLNADLTATGHSAPTIIELKDVTFNGAITYKGNNSGDGLDWRGGETFGTVTIIGGGSNTFQSVFCFSDLVVKDGPVGVVQGFQMFSSVVGGNTTITALSSNAIQAAFIGSNISGNYTQTQTNGTVVSYFDADSYPNGTVTINSGTLTRTSPSTGIAYTPGVSSNWNATIPTTVAAALDQLSSRVKALSG